MKLLWLFFLLQAIYAQAEFGTAYLKYSTLCRSWTCINTKLGLPDTLPPRQLAEETFRRVLPQGPWEDVLISALDICYGNRTRRYTNTCPGQGLLHCLVDQMIDKCPEDNWRKDDACSPVSSLAGFKHMFAMSRYDNLEKNIPKENRPRWFLKNYFDQKCCDLPSLFNSSVMQECGFNSFITYYVHKPAYEQTHTPPPMATTQSSGDVVHFVSLTEASTPRTIESTIPDPDPLDCCDMSEFIKPAWRSDCGFRLNWRGQERLVIANYTPETTTRAPVTTTTARTNAPKDLMLLPHSCSDETCVFRKLGVIDKAGVVDTTAFRRILDNFTEAHPTWKKPTARVITKCLSGSGVAYEGSCEINKILACTLDVLTENCPYNRKSDDPCIHNKRRSGCQISSSRLRPKNRRRICMLPPLVDQSRLYECGLVTLYHADHVVLPQHVPKKHSWSSSNYLCQDQKPSTTCVMNKMGVLNKYKFMDYFKMKDRIRQFTVKAPVWSTLLDVYLNAFIHIPLYGEHCSSQKKLLNVIDAMVLTCPVTQRKDTPQCRKLFREIIDTPMSANQNYTRQKVDEMMKHYQHIFLRNPFTPLKIDPVIRKPKPKAVKKPTYSYGLLKSKKSPRVKFIDIKPVVVTRLDRPLVLAPVYLRNPNLGSTLPMRQDNILRTNNSPYWLHSRGPRPLSTTPMSPISTTIPITTKIETTTSQIPIIPTTEV